MSQEAEKFKFILWFKHLFGVWATKFLYNEVIARTSLCMQITFSKIAWSIPFQKEVEWESLSFFSLKSFS